jgi:hypothetical protein
LLDYVNPNPKIISKEYQAECIQNDSPLDLLFQFPSFYHGETMWNILFSELVHDAAVQGGFRLVFLRKSENSKKQILQYTIGCVRYKVYGENKKKVPNAANNFKEVKDIVPDRLHADGIKKTAIVVNVATVPRSEAVAVANWEIASTVPFIVSSCPC